MIKSKPNSKTTSQLIKELDEIFSIFIRARDSDGCGTVTCFVTGEKVWWREADSAHYRPRAHMATRWDETNVHATTQDSNRFDPDHLEKYSNAMNKYYGVHHTISLHTKGMSLMKFTAFELQEKIDHYREEVKKLRALKKL